MSRRRTEAATFRRGRSVTTRPQGRAGSHVSRGRLLRNGGALRASRVRRIPPVAQNTFSANEIGRDSFFELAMVIRISIPAESILCRCFYPDSVGKPHTDLTADRGSGCWRIRWGRRDVAGRLGRALRHRVIGRSRSPVRCSVSPSADRRAS